MFRTKQKILLAKEESTYGTDASPTVADNAIEARNIRFNYAGDILERNLEKESLSPDAPVLGKRFCDISFEVELKGSGSKGTAPAIGDLLEACGFAETVSAGSSVTYDPASTGHKSITIYVYEVQTESGNWRLKKATGCRGTFNIRLEAGGIAVLEFKFQGLYTALSDVSDPGNASYESTLPPVVESANFTINSVNSLVVQSMNIDIANEISQRDDINSSGGIKGFVITGRKPNGTFNPEAVLSATYDWWTDWVNANRRALSVVVGSADGNKCTISAPKVSIDAINEGEKNGIITDEIPFRLSIDSGDDEIELKFE